MKKVLFIVGLHGDEKTPVEVIKKFRPKVKFLVANKPALKKGKRFLEADLNRVFPGKKKGTLEEILAGKILSRIKEIKPNVVVDFHCSTGFTPAFVILTRKSKKHLLLAKRMGIGKVVFMGRKIASGKSLIDNVSLGVSVETGKEGLKRTEEAITKVIKNIIGGRESFINERFEVFDVLKKVDPKETLVKDIRPFVEVKKGELISNLKGKKRYAPVDFYPVLPRTKSYSGTLCLMAKKC